MWNTDLLKILIIQDTGDSINSLTQTLIAENFNVISCSGEHGFFMSLKEEPDVILLDICLSNKQGFDLLKKLKSYWRTKHIPIIIATKINTQPYWDEAYALGASGYSVIGQHNPYLADRIRKLVKHYDTAAY